MTPITTMPNRLSEASASMSEEDLKRLEEGPDEDDYPKEGCESNPMLRALTRSLLSEIGEDPERTRASHTPSSSLDVSDKRI